MEEQKEEDLADQVESITTTSFQIAGCPIKVFKRFIRFCEENSTVTKVFFTRTKAPNGAIVSRKEIKREVNYAIGLDRLLDAFEADAKTEMIYARIVELESRLGAVESRGEVEVKKGPSTFGLESFGAPAKHDEVKEQ